MTLEPKSVLELMDEQAAELDAEIRAGRIPEGMSRKNVRFWKRYMKKRAKIKNKESQNGSRDKTDLRHG